MFHRMTRRAALGSIGAAALAVARSAPFASLSAVFDAPVSRVFGISADGSARDPETLYSLRTAAESQLSFDVSNNQILASFTRFGELSRVCSATGVSLLPPEQMKGGVYSTKQLVRGGTWLLSVRLANNRVLPLDKGSENSVDLAGRVFPIFQCRCAGLRIRRLIFAPCDGHSLQAPRALIALISISNESVMESAGILETGAEAILLTDGRFRLAPGDNQIVAAAYLLTEDESRIRSRSPLDWFNATWRRRTSPYGEAVIPDAPYFAESIARFGENCRQSALCLPDGKVAGGFLGSDVDSRPVNWVRDLYYSMLAMSMFDPDLCAESILYFLKWNLPPHPVGRGLTRFPHAGRVTQSLGNALSPLLLSGAYYQMTGDRAFFRDRPDVFQSGRALLNDVLASRRGEAFLFPSMFISDGDARGDYHTGSNIAAWKAFDVMARLAREVYDEPKSAAKWAQAAARIREDIWARCAGAGPLGRQFYEGVTELGAFVQGHDGEESDTTLAPFYGFCAGDEPALLNHARQAFRETNPFYSKDLDAIWWYNENWSSATFPGWITALAGETDEKELAARLHRIRQLTDLDGSIWWWPYKYDTRDRSAVLRANNARKCGWASSVYLCRFVHDIVGIGFDLPARQVAFRPFLPWSRFAWRNCRLGRGLFHLQYERTPRAIMASLANLGSETLTATIELMVPLHTKVEVPSDAKPGRHYGRASISLTRALRPGDELRADVRLGLPQVEVRPAGSRLVVLEETPADGPKGIWSAGSASVDQ
jgi:hypothetical protein